ncbi:MAG TPA: BTAD domain-containing putative transcriptional regulator [Anaerolineales bacterium]|nr:BTAD domain-containing putative transcriptional regulator [Anaerolineales bacterium]
MLWPDSLEETARDNLRHALWRMRKALEAASSTRFLHAVDVAISFKESPDYWLDAAELEKLNEHTSADELSAVLSEYQGELLPGFYDEWVVLEREHLYSIFEHHMARLLSLLQAEQRWLDILDWGERWIKLGQKPEPAYRALMTAHAAKGDMSKVAATYERCAKSLKEFGMEPSEQTKELYKNLKSGKEVPKAVSVEAKPIAKVPSSNIPVPLTSFIGRQKELQEIAKLVSSSRLVTLTGPGGVGKTRLAIQTSNKLVSKFKDGVWWINLVALKDASLVPQSVAKVVNIGEVPNQPLIETLARNLQSRQILLVLDNCEHLISACAQLADYLLGTCKNLRILATSREALDILGETAWAVPSLALPKAKESLSVKSLNQFESIHLFKDRAMLAQPRFELTDQNAKLVVQICQRLSGMPLAIELAAARTKMMMVEEIAKRLDDRFSLLTSGNRAALPRHQTLRAAIDWSYGLLNDPERILFRRLAAFIGGFTLDAAEAVCSFGELRRDQVFDLLGRLVDKSLVIAEPTSTLNETRYFLLETIREYAREKLLEAAEEDFMRDLHLEFFANFAERIEPLLFDGHATWNDRLYLDIENIEAALQWSMIHRNNEPVHQSAKRVQFGLSLVGALSWFLVTRAPHELALLKQALAQPIAAQKTLARAKALNTAGFLDWTARYLDEGRAFLEEALSIGRKLKNTLTVAWSHAYLGAIADFQGDYARANLFLEQAISLSPELGEWGKLVSAFALTLQGDTLTQQANLLRARGVFENSISLLRELESKNWLAYAVRLFGYLELREGNYDRSLAYFKESLWLNREVGHHVGKIAGITSIAAYLVARSQLVSAAKLFGAVDALVEAANTPLVATDRMEYEHYFAEVHNQLDGAAFAKAWGDGHAMILEQAIEFALKEADM